MRKVVELLERKRTLLDRRQEAHPEQLAEIERDLQEINRILTRLESEEAPPTAPLGPGERACGSGGRSGRAQSRRP
jgi:hypothetical protein